MSEGASQSSFTRRQEIEQSIAEFKLIALESGVHVVMAKQQQPVKLRAKPWIGDPYRTKAAELFGCALTEVTKAQRQWAKKAMFAAASGNFDAVTTSRIQSKVSNMANTPKTKGEIR